ncbi:MAG: outer membrane beta-barrel protein [Gammaproteobacteria bacterium]|nr:outer membrane beta-barrel protein [Gammaproteobacteria bacterium]
MINKKLVLLLSLFLLPQLTQATSAKTQPQPRHPLYIGAMGGYGSTTWQGLVPSSDNSNDAIMMSTPVEVSEGGGVWGLFAGYELIPAFAVEASYMHYPDATVSFSPESMFSFDHNKLTDFSTQTETVSLMGKVMFYIPKTTTKLYSSTGIASLHRNDMLLNTWRVTPTFGAGLNRRFGEHVMAEIGANYTAGFGESQLNPTETYLPFLYSVTARLAYCF